MTEPVPEVQAATRHLKLASEDRPPQADQGQMPASPALSGPAPLSVQAPVEPLPPETLSGASSPELAQVEILPADDEPGATTPGGATVEDRLEVDGAGVFTPALATVEDLPEDDGPDASTLVSAPSENRPPSRVPNSAPSPASSDPSGAGKIESVSTPSTQTAQEKGTKNMTASTSSRSRLSFLGLLKPWTPERLTQIGKEVVTAIIAILIIQQTLAIAQRTFDLAGDPTKLAAGKDILLLMLSLAGVVIGYYFGRVPADARAAQAQEQAAEATTRADDAAAETEEVRNRALRVAEYADSLTNQVSRSTARDAQSAGLNAAAAEDARRLREEVYQMLNTSRVRR